MRRLALLMTLVVSSSAGCARPLAVGSKNFTEQVILGEMIARLLEDRGVEVDRRLNLGGTLICHSALDSGRLDVYVEYTGTALTAILKQPALGDPDDVYRKVSEEYRKRFGLEWGAPLGFNNTFALAMKPRKASELGIRKISDLIRHQRILRGGFGHEFFEREDGLPGLKRAYGLEFEISPRSMELGLIYQALMEDEVDLVAGSATDGLIGKLGLTVLEDDRGFFPPYDAAAVYRPEARERYPVLSQVLELIAGQLDETTMRRLNFAVDGERRSEKQVVEELLAQRGWIEIGR